MALKICANLWHLRELTVSHRDKAHISSLRRFYIEAFHYVRTRALHSVTCVTSETIHCAPAVLSCFLIWYNKHSTRFWTVPNTARRSRLLAKYCLTHGEPNVFANHNVTGAFLWSTQSNNLSAFTLQNNLFVKYSAHEDLKATELYSTIQNSYISVNVPRYSNRLNEAL